MRKDARDDGVGLRVPSDLDRSICSYDALSGSNREKFDRASFWFSASRRMCDVSITAAFAALVSAIESLTSSGEVHQFTCPVCSGVTDHRVPGPTKLFKDFLATYALGATLAKDRDDMYDLRSDLVHGEHLVELDREIPIMGWTPPGFKKKTPTVLRPLGIYSLGVAKLAQDDHAVSTLHFTADLQGRALAVRTRCPRGPNVFHIFFAADPSVLNPPRQCALEIKF